MGGYILPNGQKLQTDEYIEHLEAENERLREALETIAKEWDGQLGTGQMLTDFCRAALSPPTDSEEWVCPICRTAMCGYAEHRFAPTDSEGK